MLKHDHCRGHRKSVLVPMCADPVNEAAKDGDPQSVFPVMSFCNMVSSPW